MKKIVLAAALIVSGLLVGCNQLTQYTVSEQEINQALEKHNNFSKDIGVPGLADAHIVLTNLTSQIGREEPNKVTRPVMRTSICPPSLAIRKPTSSSS